MVGAFTLAGIFAALRPTVMCALFLALGVVAGASGNLTVSGMVPLLLVVFVACSGGMAAGVLFRWCFPAQRSDSVSMLVGMFLLVTLLDSNEVLVHLFSSGTSEEIPFTRLLHCIPVVLGTLSIILLTLTTTVLLLEVPIVWGLGYVGKTIRPEVIVEFRWCILLWFVWCGWALLESFFELGLRTAIAVFAGGD